ncbi:MAG: hypothetical protein AAF633_18105 [Chloroflexota bacterium]
MSESKSGPVATIVEIATFQLKDGVSIADFQKLDKAVEVEHVSKQPGFVSRESGSTEDGAWVAIVHWKTAADAEASMASFGNAPAAADFMANLDASTMQMTRYLLN